MENTPDLNFHSLCEKIVNSSPNAIYIFDLEKEVNSFVNPLYTKLTGYTLQDIDSIGRQGFFSLFHPEDRKRVSEHLKVMSGAQNGDILEIEYRFKTADGGWVWLLSRDKVFGRTKEGKVQRLLGACVDISRRKKIEKDLDESRLRFSSVLENANDAAYRRNLRTDRYDYMSPAIEQITGYTPEEMGTMTFDNVFDLIHPDDRGKAAQEIEKTLKGGKGFVEFRTRTKNGSYRWVADNIRVLTGEDGKAEYRIGNIRDIMERKQTEERLERQRKELEAVNARIVKEKARLDAVMETLPVGVGILDAAGGVIRVNRAFKQLWGESLPTVCSITDYREFKAWRLGTGKPLAPEEWASARAVQEGEHIIGQLLEIQRFDGSRCPVINSASPVFGPQGEILGSAVAIQDITCLRETETALQKSRFRFELLSRTAGLLLASPDPGGSINEICREAMAHMGCHLFFNFLLDEKTGRLRLNAYSGILKEEARKIEWLDYGVDLCPWVYQIEPPLIGHDVSNACDVIAEKFNFCGIQSHVCHPILYQGKFMGTLFFGARIQKFFSAEDVTLVKTIANQVATAMERSCLITQLRNSRDEMEARVRERTAELEERNRELQEFAHIASHDLQEPLRKVLTFGDILADGAGDLLSEESRDSIHRMQNAAGRMRMLLDSLLRYSRVSTMSVPFEKIDLRESVKSALSNLELAIRENDGHVEVGELPTLEADPIQMIQLFQNLIANAVKFHPEEASPRVKIYSAALETDIGCKRTMHRICVEDNGVGFDEGRLYKIFMPFQRLHGKGRYSGIGMGLAICKKIMDRHKGNITAKSAVGKGSTFIITLPATQENNDESSE